MTLAMARPVRYWMLWATAGAVITMVRWASIASRVRWSYGRARRSLLDIRNERSTLHRSWYLPITSAAGMTAAVT